MFSFVSKVFEKIWWEDDEPERGGNPRPNLPHASHDVSAERPSTRFNTACESNRKDTKGHITSLHNGYGLIDHEIYFSFKLFPNNDIPKVGSCVEFHAERKDDVGGWMSTHVVPYRDLRELETDSWDDITGDPEPASRPEADLGRNVNENPISQVVSIHGNIGTLCNNITFELNSVCDGYIPAKGDWISLESSLNQESGIREVRLVKPLREKEFEGEINSTHGGFGYIDEDIYFTSNVCGNYLPKKGHLVYGRAIESCRGRSSWRAVEVKPKASELKRCPTSPSQAKSLVELFKNKENIEISEDLDFGDMQLKDVVAKKVIIRNGGTKVRTLRSSRICNSGDGQFSIDEVNYVPPNKDIDINTAFLVAPGKSLFVTIACRASNLGQDQRLIIFDFGDFKIGRHLKVSVHDSSFKSILAPIAPYEGRKNRMSSDLREKAADGWVVPGRRPLRKNIKLPNRLPESPIPKKLEQAYQAKEKMTLHVPALREPLDMNNYSARFSALLHIEEIQQNMNMREFDMEETCMTHRGEYICLDVPGLSEGRPSVLVGDRVLVIPPGEFTSEPSQEGYVHEVHSQEILIKFHPDFHRNYAGENYNIHFVLNRTQLRRCHQAVHFAPSLGSAVLFPSCLIPKVPQTHGKKISSPMKGESGGPKYINPKLNHKQKCAARRILTGQSRPTPYIIFGPPGTGKTITLVEALLQVHLSISSSRIIACAPSNSAADLIATRLHMSGMVNQNVMVRLNSYSRAGQEVPEVIEDYCKTGDDLELVSRYSIIVCTCSSAGMMYALGLKTGHFTHVFIDEAGQATEPECMIAIGLLAGTDGQVVLAGDPQQLGPVLQSNVANHFGLGTSYLERLIKSPLYARNDSKFADHGCYDPLIVTKLQENYRSHAALVKLPSLLFYHDELQVSADPSLTQKLLSWEELPNPDFPMIFHGVRGQDMREGSSPSWFNPMELMQVVRYLKSLISNPLLKIAVEDIGIITPYRKQVEKIRLLIDKLGMEPVKVGSVEEFQGQERPVMILSTVRANEEHINSDALHNLGFLSNPKRFNVSITRAQSLLIIIGNPHILSQDRYWRLLLQYCLHHGAVTGSDFPDLPPPENLDFSFKPAAKELLQSASSSQLPATSYKTLSDKDAASQDDDKGRSPDSVNIKESVTCRESVKPANEKNEKIESESGDDETLKQSPTNSSHTLSEEDTGPQIKAKSQSPGSVKVNEPAISTSSVREVNEKMDKKGESNVGIDGNGCTPPRNNSKHPTSLISDKVDFGASGEGSIERTLKQQTPMKAGSEESEPCTKSQTRGDVWMASGDSASPPQTNKSVGGRESDGTSPEATLETNTSKSLLSPCPSTPASSGRRTPRKRVSIADRLAMSFRECELHDTSGPPESPSKQSSPSSPENITSPAVLKRQCSTPLTDSQPKKTGRGRGKQASVLHDKEVVPLRPGGSFNGPPEISYNQPRARCDVSNIHNKGEISRGEERDEVDNNNTPDNDPWGVRTTGDGEVKQAAYSPSFSHQPPASTEKVSKAKLREESENGNYLPAGAVPLCQSAHDTENPNNSPPTELEKKIIKQIEYYFGDFNLFRDTYMKKQLAMDDGWVPFSVLITFHRLTLLTRNFHTISTALLKSTSGLLEVDEFNCKVRRTISRPIPDYNEWPNQLKDRSLFVIGLLTREGRDDLESYFEQWGVIEHIHILTPSHKSLSGSLVTYPFVVVYQKMEDANRVLRLNRLNYKGSNLFLHHREDVKRMLFNERRGNVHKKTRNASNDNGVNPSSSATHDQGPLSDGNKTNTKNHGLLPAPKLTPVGRGTNCVYGQGQGDGLLPLPPSVGFQVNTAVKRTALSTSPGGLQVSSHRRGIGRGRSLDLLVERLAPKPVGNPCPNSTPSTHVQNNNASKTTESGYHIDLPSVQPPVLDLLEQNDSDVVIESDEEESSD